MSFRDNLQHLRATRNMTQEQLAMMVGVSRQSVTKWESGRSYPEMDKLMKLCQIFDCTLDELVQGDLTTREVELELAMPATALAEDVVGYEDHQRSFARRIAIGVTAIIVGMACASASDLFLGDGPTALLFFGGVAVGLAFIIPAGLDHSAFQRAHPYVADFYTSEQRMAEQHAFGIQLCVGIVLVLVGLVWGAFADGRPALQPFAGTVFLLLVAAGVGILVYAGLMSSRMNVEEYNISALEELSEEEISGIVGSERAPLVLEKVRRNRRVSAACGIIMLLATAIALPLMFWATSFGEPFWSRFFWIPWMVGGLLCGIASIAITRKG
ncbi:MAG: helix-turn-helix transcriptional regulator [Atopobiaceae bacterium]|nr:helix-turn-helix transcriptional regulator [Atopobiaceae bacterium]